MARYRFFGGLLLILAGAVLMLFGGSDFPLPVSITLTIVGVVLVAVSRRQGRA